MWENGGFPPTGGQSLGSVLTLPSNLGGFFKWGFILLCIILLLVVLSILGSIYTDWIWFDSLGFLGVFTTILWTRLGLLSIAVAVLGGLIALNVWFAHRRSKGETSLSLAPEIFDWLEKSLRLGMVIGGLVVTLIFGFAASNRWQLLLRLAQGEAFGVNDPVFGQDVSFFTFTLPLLHFVQGWVLAGLIVLLLVVTLVYVVNYVLRGTGVSVSPAMRNHLSFLGGLVFFCLAIGHWFDRYELVFSDGGAVFGATYADVNARMLMLLLATLIAVASGAMLLLSLLPFLRGGRGNRLIIGAVILWVLVVLLGGNLYPSFVQRFRVDPNELELEKPYIARNIEFTRAGFGLSEITERDYSVRPEITAEDIADNQKTMSNLRLWDPRPLRDTYNQIQHLRLYYEFLDVDVDRYEIDGEYRQVLLGARELAPQNLPVEAQRWVNQRLQYTHGYGAAASPVTEFTAEGGPEFVLKDVPPIGQIEITRPEIYYGENIGDYVIVNSLQQEFDHPTEEDVPVYVNYLGAGGVQLSSFMRRLAYAWQFRDINTLISDRITPESKFQYRRNVQERVAAVAPFLVLDTDPYLVVDDEGRLLWIQDAYTTTDRYPYSRPSDEKFNYIRNSVKVVIDAYNGTLEFYVADPQDPLVMTYANIFPTLFRPIDHMASDLRAHLRYPGDLFSIQAATYLQYHMTDSTVFFNKEDQWSIPSERFFDRQQSVMPYYVIMTLPDEDMIEFVLILPFTPAEKPNMVAWLAARMDGDHYGQLMAFYFPRGMQIYGPVQIEARIDNDTEISQQFTLWDQSGSQVIRGNLLVIPLGETILYVEPIYLQAEGVALPELKRVILASSTRVVMEKTLEKAVKALLDRPSDSESAMAIGAIGEGDTLQQVEEIKETLRNLREGVLTLEEAIDQLAEQLEEGKQ